MNQRNAFILATALTAFVLVLIGGVAARAAGQPATPTAPATATTATDPTADPAVQAAIQQREAAYQQLIQQANERLQQAYQQLNQTAGQPQPQTQPVAPAAPDASAYAVSPQMATMIALTAAPGAALTRAPELVNFQGSVAYEMLLDRGTVYVDANSGQVLYNGAAAASGGRASGEGGEHEDGEHEEDD